MNTDSPTVSVVIPPYYRNETLRDAIESVQEQRYPSVELIVVDDSGERFAESIVTEYNGASYIGLDENRGANVARTIGANQATGSYVQFLDDDDVLHPDKTGEQVALLESDSEVGVAYCGQETTGGERSLPLPDGRGDVLEQALKFELQSCVTSTMLIDVDVLNRILPLPDTPGADDTYLKIELSRFTHFDFTEEPLVVRRDFDDSRGTSKGAVVGTKRVIEEYRSLYEQHPPSVRKEAVATAYTREAEYYLTEQNWSFKAIKTQALACYCAPEIRISRLGRFIGMLFGKPGIETAKWAYRSYRR